MLTIPCLALGHSLVRGMRPNKSKPGWEGEGAVVKQDCLLLLVAASGTMQGTLKARHLRSPTVRQGRRCVVGLLPGASQMLCQAPTPPPPCKTAWCSSRHTREGKKQALRQVIEVPSSRYLTKAATHIVPPNSHISTCASTARSALVKMNLIRT